ncbi:MAG: phenylalanine--tRNA ligase subunit alpha [Deltaproteobacteria bacterium]|nr:phenylalanine--tRNA ligase subunit alpha [Deltaproteobacteria bacterium]
MKVEEWIAELADVERELSVRLANAQDVSQVEDVRVWALGRKAGRVTSLMRRLRDLAPEDRPRAGDAVNSAKVRIERALDGPIVGSGNRQPTLPAIDVTLPGRRPPRGSLHPLTQVRRRIEEIFVGLGFRIEQGPEIEDEHHNFEALNTPADHPARDMQDTFYLSGHFLLRTQTSPVQIRLMETSRPPIRAIMPGRVFRRDSDATHSPMFHQVEGLLVDSGVTMAHLKGALMSFLTAFFGEGTRARFRPSFFPFTEPSAEVDIACVLCMGAGCRVCKGSGWLEVLGCGMVDPEVFRAVGYDPESVTGYAFGMGIERLTMLRYAIDDMRLLFENDHRFLEQF